MTIFAMRLARLMLPLFGNRVVHIVGVSTNKQVRRIYAGWIVALVAAKLIWQKRSSGRQLHH